MTIQVTVTFRDYNDDCPMKPEWRTNREEYHRWLRRHLEGLRDITVESISIRPGGL